MKECKTCKGDSCNMCKPGWESVEEAPNLAKPDCIECKGAGISGY